MLMSIRSLRSAEFNAAYSKLLGVPGIPVRTAYKLATNARIIKKEVEIYEAARLAIINAEADKDENGQVATQQIGEQIVAKIPPEKIKMVNEKINELENIEVEVKEISIEDFGDISLAAEILFPLEFIVG